MTANSYQVHFTSLLNYSVKDAVLVSDLFKKYSSLDTHTLWELFPSQ